jgi:hypothetical protein
MAFPAEVKEKALIACGRKCCICHKFCGTRMECHHIVPEERGGDDIFENCIPVCFDCHADIGHYNPKHPKGNRFSPNELREHRDRWYDCIKVNPSLLEDTETSDAKNHRRIFRDAIRVIKKATLATNDHVLWQTYSESIARVRDAYAKVEEDIGALNLGRLQEAVEEYCRLSREEIENRDKNAKPPPPLDQFGNYYPRPHWKPPLRTGPPRERIGKLLDEMVECAR